jgi:hypothetical protein
MADKVDLSSIVAQESPRGSVDEIGRLARLRVKIGGWTVGGVIFLILVVLGLISGYAVLSMPPSFEELRAAETQNPLETYKDLRSAWFGEIKDLLQLLVVSLLIPLVTTIIGYIFGRQTNQAAQ